MEDLKLFSKIFESNPLPMSITSIEENKFIKVNPAFLEKTGYSKNDTLGKTVEELGIVVDFKKFKDVSDRRLNGEKIKDEEIVIRCKDGSLLTGLFSIEVINNNGESSFLTVMIYITLKKKQSLELERFFSVSLDLLCIIDMERRFLKINKEWEEILGYSTSELKGHKFLDFVHLDDISSTIEAFNKVRNGEKLNRFVNRYISIYGDCRYISIPSQRVLKGESFSEYRYIGSGKYNMAYYNVLGIPLYDKRKN